MIFKSVINFEYINNFLLKSLTYIFEISRLLIFEIDFRTCLKLSIKLAALKEFFPIVIMIPSRDLVHYILSFHHRTMSACSRIIPRAQK